MNKDTRTAKEVLIALGEAHEKIAMDGSDGFGPNNGKVGDRLHQSKFKLGDLVKINRPGDRRIYKIVGIETFDGSRYNYEGVATTGGNRGSHFTSAAESDLRLSNEPVNIPPPKWIPKTGEKVVVSHLNFDVFDIVKFVKQENGRWNMYLKSTSPMPGRKATAYWDGKTWNSGSYGSALNGFNVKEYTGQKIRDDFMD